MRSARHVLRAGAWLALSSIGLRAARYRSLRRLIDRLPVRQRQGTALRADEYGRAIARAARIVPGATCLAQALAAACLLRRDGVASTLTIGVAVDGGRTFEAHAWLDADDVRITGAREGDLHVIVRDTIAAGP